MDVEHLAVLRDLARRDHVDEAGKRFALVLPDARKKSIDTSRLGKEIRKTARTTGSVIIASASAPLRIAAIVVSSGTPYAPAWNRSLTPSTRSEHEGMGLRRKRQLGEMGLLENYGRGRAHAEELACVVSYPSADV